MHNYKILGNLVSSKWLCLVGVFLLLIFQSCKIPQIDSIEAEDLYAAKLSFPVGVIGISVPDIIETGNIKPTGANDMLPNANYFKFQNSFYKTPVSYDTLVSLEFDIERSAEYLDNMQFLMLRTNIINRSHATLKIQIYFRNYNDVYFDSIFTAGPIVINGGKIASDNTVTPAPLLQNDEHYSRDRILRFDEVSHLEMRVHFEFPQGQLPTLIFKNEELLSVQIGFRTGIEINPDEI